MLLTEERSRLKFPEGITSRRGRLGKNTVDCFAAKMAESVQARLVPSLFLFGRALWFSRFLQLGRRRRRVRRGLAVGGFLGEPQRAPPGRQPCIPQRRWRLRVPGFPSCGTRLVRVPCLLCSCSRTPRR